MGHRFLLLSNLVLLLALGVLGIGAGGSRGLSNRDIVARLDALSKRMDDRFAALSAQVEGCTPERYRLNLCAPGEAPFELNVSVCGELGAEAAIEGKFAVEAKLSGEAGIGWKDGPDGDVKVEGSMPIPIPVAATIPPLVIVAPNEVAVGGSGKGALGIQGCIEGIRAPLSAFFTRAQILQILDRMDAGAQKLAEAMAGVTGAVGGMSVSSAAASGPVLDTEHLADAVAAARQFASSEFRGEDPLAVFSSDAVEALRGSLPKNAFAERLLSDPGAVLPRVDPLAPQLCENVAALPSVAGRLDPICSMTAQLPKLDELLSTLDRVDQIEQQLQDLPDVISFLVQEALPDAPEPQPVLPPQSPFCARFPRLCVFQ